MKAAIYSTYGSPQAVTVQDIPNQKPGENEIRIQVKATSVTSGDVRLRAANPFIIRFLYGLKKPKNQVLGHEYAGVVESVGSSVTKFTVGDRVVGSMGLKSGAHAEYVVVPENGMINRLEDSVPLKVAATSVISFLTADYFLNKTPTNAKQILIHGASGSVGTMAIQLAKLKGMEVTAVCSGRHVKAVKAIGADYVIDYSKTDFTKVDVQYDAIFSTVGKTTFQSCLNILADDGYFLASEAVPADYIKAGIIQKRTGKKFIAGVSKPTQASFNKLSELLNEGKIQSTIDSEFSLDRIQDAHALVDTGHKFGNVAITIA